MNKSTAFILAGAFAIPLDKDFHDLSYDTVARVLEAADHAKYKRPKNANGSRARYFYEALKRAAYRDRMPVMEWITLKRTIGENSDSSSLHVEGAKLRVTGILPHNCTIELDSTARAKLRAWLDATEVQHG